MHLMLDELQVLVAQCQAEVTRYRCAYRAAMRRVDHTRACRDEALMRLRRRQRCGAATAGGDHVGAGEGVLTMLERLEPAALRYIEALQEARDAAHEVLSAEAHLARVEHELASAQSSRTTRPLVWMPIADSRVK